MSAFSIFNARILQRTSPRARTLPCTGRQIALDQSANRRVMGRARRYLNELAKKWGEPWLSRIQVAINPRLFRVAGRWVAPKGVLELNRTVARRTISAQYEILCHEAAHAVVSRRCGRNKCPHGTEWAGLVAAA